MQGDGSVTNPTRQLTPGGGGWSCSTPLARRSCAPPWAAHKSLTLIAVAVLLAALGCVRDRVVSHSFETRSGTFLSTNAPLELRHYDEALAWRVEKRWSDLLDERPPSSLRRGQVVLAFHLHNNGRVTDVEVLENTSDGVGAALCQKAVRDCRPFPECPELMRKVIGRDYRKIAFLFRYD